MFAGVFGGGCGIGTLRIWGRNMGDIGLHSALMCWLLNLGLLVGYVRRGFWRWLWHWYSTDLGQEHGRHRPPFGADVLVAESWLVGWLCSQGFLEVVVALVLYGF